MDTQKSKLIPYPEAIARSGLTRRTWFDRVRESGITIYIDGRDRRLRLVDERDIAKLVEVRHRPRREVAMETP